MWSQSRNRLKDHRSREAFLLAGSVRQPRHLLSFGSVHPLEDNGVKGFVLSLLSLKRTVDDTPSLCPWSEERGYLQSAAVHADSPGQPRAYTSSTDAPSTWARGS